MKNLKIDIKSKYIFFRIVGKKIYPDPNLASIKILPVDVLDCVLRVLLVVNLHEPVLTLNTSASMTSPSCPRPHLDVYVPEVSISIEQLLNVALATIMSEVAEKESWHLDS